MDEFSRNSDLLAQYATPDEAERVGSIVVGIAGAGGLGSNCAVALVRSGFTRLVIADFDTVEASNLNRQAYVVEQIGEPKVSALAWNLQLINPSVRIEAVEVRLDSSNLLEVFADCAAVVEAFDDPECKALLVEELLPAGKFVVGASGLGGIGASDRICVHKVKETFYVVGDMTTEVCDRTGAFAPCVGIAAAKQADIVLEWALTGRVTIDRPGGVEVR